MRSIGLLLLCPALIVPRLLPAQAPGAEAQVRQTVQAFYAAFNSHLPESGR